MKIAAAPSPRGTNNERLIYGVDVPLRTWPDRYLPKKLPGDALRVQRINSRTIPDSRGNTFPVSAPARHRVLGAERTLARTTRNGHS